MEIQSLTFKDLYEAVISEVERCKKSGDLEELMNQEVILDIYSPNGNVVNGNAGAYVGWLEGDGVLVIGSLSSLK